jgi:hypothetical protein
VSTKKYNLKVAIISQHTGQVELDGRAIEHSEYRKGMRQLNTTYHSGMAGYLMDFGFGGFIGYGKGVSVGLVMEELNISMRYY